MLIYKTIDTKVMDTNINEYIYTERSLRQFLPGFSCCAAILRKMISDARGDETISYIPAHPQPRPNLPPSAPIFKFHRYPSTPAVLMVT